MNPMQPLRNAAFTLAAAVAIAVTGCNNTSPPVAQPTPGLAADELVPTLERIAQTGEYKPVLTPLTAGLEQAGYMQEAAEVQAFAQAESPDAVKSLAANMAMRLRAAE